jgi:acyl-CoA thioesterase YciA
MGSIVQEPAIRVMMFPRDTNGFGTIFGGVILSYIDLAGGIEAHKYAPKRFVTKAMREVEFVAPVYVGDLVSFYAQVIRVGRTSLTVQIIVEAERGTSHKSKVRVTEAEVIYVAVDENGRPTPIKED